MWNREQLEAKYASTVKTELDRIPPISASRQEQLYCSPLLWLACRDWYHESHSQRTNQVRANAVSNNTSCKQMQTHAGRSLEKTTGTNCYAAICSRKNKMS